MSDAEQQQQQQQHKDPQPPKQPPGLRTIDFSTSQPLRQMTTTLRRVWLLDPSLSREELADPATVQERFRSLCEAVSGEITSDNDDDDEARWDHARWLGRTKLPLLGAPVVQVWVDPPPPHSAESPFREGVYDSYRHVFADLWRVLQAEEQEQEEEEEEAGGGRKGKMLDRFDAADGSAVSLGVLRTPFAKGEELLAYPTDTFLCPVWIRPRARVTFSVGGRGHSWSAGMGQEEKGTWATGIWVQGEAEVTLSTEVEDPSEDGLTITAVFVAGHCRRRDGEGEGEGGEGDDER